MASSHNVELEAAKFLYKVIQDSNDDPAKLATKLHVILQHMESTAKEHLMSCQVISRAVVTLINQHGLDIEALNSSRLPLCGGSSQAVGVAKDSRVGLAENELPKMDPFASGQAPVAPSITGKLLMKGRGGRKSHDVWEGVTKLYGDRVMCRHCKFEFAAPSATRIRSHLCSIPNKGIRGCPNFGQAANGSSERDKNIARSCNLEVASRIASSTRERNKVNETQKGTTLQLQVDTKKKRISYQVGPFSISHDKYDELDIQLIQYVFDPSQNPSEEVVIFPHYHLKRSEFTTLGPEAFLNAMVIDVFAENLTKIEEEKMKIKPTRNCNLHWIATQVPVLNDII